jgi:hypothetical protein
VLFFLRHVCGASAARRCSRAERARRTPGRPDARGRSLKCFLTVASRANARRTGQSSATETDAADLP